MPDPWLWRVEYADGSTLDEYDDDAPQGRGWDTAVAYGQARGTCIARVVLMPQRDELATHVVRPTADATVRVFRRRLVTVSMETGAQVGQADPITGIACKVGGHGVYTFLFADGSIVVSDDLNAV